MVGQEGQPSAVWLRGLGHGPQVVRFWISINNIVTLGGFVFRGKPGNVGTWTEIIGDADPIASLSAAAVPDAFYEESGVTHIPNFPVPGLPSYLTGNGLVQSINDIQRAGLR